MLPGAWRVKVTLNCFGPQALGKAQEELSGRKFDVVMMDPPWQLASSNPTRGVRPVMLAASMSPRLFPSTCHPLSSHACMIDVCVLHTVLSFFPLLCP